MQLRSLIDFKFSFRMSLGRLAAIRHAIMEGYLDKCNGVNSLAGLAAEARQPIITLLQRSLLTAEVSSTSKWNQLIIPTLFTVVWNRLSTNRTISDVAQEFHLLHGTQSVVGC